MPVEPTRPVRRVRVQQSDDRLQELVEKDKQMVQQQKDTLANFLAQLEEFDV